MSHLRDIQKLRNNRNINQPYPNKQSFSQPSQPDYLNINFDRVNDPESARTFTNKFKQSGAKFMNSREIISNNYDKKYHKRGQSNGISYSQKRQSDLVSPGLTIYNLSMKLNQKPSNPVNPLTSRRQKPQSVTDVGIPTQNVQKQTKKVNQKQQKIVSTKQQTVRQQKINRAGITVLYPIGKGGFGKVWKVQYKKNHQVLAMKQMKKAKIIQKKSINSVMNQRALLAKLKHPFIINMVAAFQDRQNLYLLMDYIDGGDLRYHIGRRRKFNEKQTKFFIANMILGLQYLHKNKIIHRDMKPENMVFDSDGYLRITDMGISRQYKEDNSQDTSGTPGYMSPEVICRKNHSFGVDYFAVGVMGYQFMLGRRPYVGKNRKEIRDQILSKQAMVKPEQLPQKWSTQSIDFINKLLQRNPANRLGYNGIEQIKNHPWMSNIDWRKLAKKQIQAPYIPLSIQQNYDDYKDQISQDSVDENQQETLLMLRDREVQSLFDDYYFDRSSQTTQNKKNLTRTSYSTTSYPQSNPTSNFSTNVSTNLMNSNNPSLNLNMNINIPANINMNMNNTATSIRMNQNSNINTSSYC